MDFWGKFLLCPKWLMGHFLVKDWHFWSSLEIFHQIFLKLYLMIGIKKWAKVAVLDFKGKFILCSKWGKWSSNRSRGLYWLCTLYLSSFFFTHYVITSVLSRVSLYYMFNKMNELLENVMEHFCPKLYLKNVTAFSYT